MQPIIHSYDASRTYFTEELCHINELSNSVNDAAVSIAEARVEPGITTRWHRLLGIVERYVIVSGVGLVELGGMAATEVKRGAVVLIPPNCPQRITNTGNEDLVFLAICSPRFEQQYYEDVEALMRR